jgi:hypothetical protein
MNINKLNIFTCKDVKLASGLSYILNYLELKGKNCILFHPIKPIDNISEHTYLESWTQINKISYNTLEDLMIKINTQSNLFRTDIVVIDLWNHNPLDYKLLKLYKEISQNIILITKKVPPSLDYNNHFIISFDKSELIIEDLINNLVYNFSDYIKMDIRNIKIDNLFD